LVEATLLWKLGKSTANRIAGHYKGKFRRQDTLHHELHGFDFRNELYFFNVGHYEDRKWEHCREWNFIAAAHGSVFRKAICGFHPGDVFAGYMDIRQWVMRDPPVGAMPPITVAAHKCGAALKARGPVAVPVTSTAMR